MTLPPTDAPGTSGPSGTTNGFRLLLVAAAILLASILVVTPERVAARR